ncbi:MAG: hypothetical protein AAB897_03470 [Patescibacteria group bacterium]
MKFITGLFCALILSATILFAEGDNLHTPEGFMPPFEGWRAVKTKPFLTQTRKFRRDRKVKNTECRILKSSDGREGSLCFVQGIIVSKFVEVEKNHAHVALLKDDGKSWILGEAGTLSMVKTQNGVSFCLEDFFVKKQACGAEILIGF